MKRKLKKIEALAFGKLDAELRNAIQGIQIIDYRIRDLEREKSNLKQIMEQKSKQYQELIDILVLKYKIINKDNLVIDPDSYIIKEEIQED